MHRRHGNMHRIAWLCGRNRAPRRKFVSQVAHLIRDVQKRQEVDFIKALLRRRWITAGAFSEHEF
jgi:hypothetical protein